MQGEREMGREREGGREELLLPNYSDWAGSALFTNRTRFSNPGSPNLTSKHRGAPDWETGREREREITKKKQQHTKKLCVIILASVHTPSPPPSSNSTTTSTPACRIIWTICCFFWVFFLEERHSQEEGELLLPHSRCSFFVLSFFFPLLLLRRWSESLGLCLFFPSSSLCLFFRASEPIWMRWESGAQRCSALYGSCGLQDRGRQLHVASRTWSHAFPRDLRGSHPRNHGGDGEKVENGVTPGEGHAAERKRVGKSQAEPCVK